MRAKSGVFAVWFFFALVISSVPAAAQAAAPIKWRMQTMFAAGFSWEIIPKRFAERVKQASGGRLEITPYPAGALVPTFQMLDSAGKGVVDVGWAGGSYWTGVMPSALVMWGMPMALGDNVEEYHHMWYDMGMIDVARAEYAKRNVYFVSPIFATPYGGTMSRKPIKTLKDFKGLKLRSFSAPGELWKSFGASIVSIPPGEMYTALASGTIDAAHWAGPDEFYAMKIHETAKYYLRQPVIGHIANDVFVNMDKWKALPPDLQHIVEMAARIASIESAAYGRYLNMQSEAKMKAAGVTFYDLPQADLATLQQTANKLLDEKSKADPASTKAAAILRAAMKGYGYQKSPTP